MIYNEEYARKIREGYSKKNKEQTNLFVQE